MLKDLVKKSELDVGDGKFQWNILNSKKGLNMNAELYIIYYIKDIYRRQHR